MLVTLSLACTGASEDHVTHDLVASLPLAQVRRETSVIDFGTPQARSHLIRGWSVDHRGRAGNTTFVWSIGERSVLEFFLGAERDLVLALRCAPFRFPQAPPQSIEVRINGREVDRIVLRPGPATYELTLPRETVHTGTNRLEFFYAYTKVPRDVGPSRDPRPLAVAWHALSLGPAATAPDPVPGSDVPRLHPRGDAAQSSLFLPWGTQVDYYLRLGPESTLALQDVELPAGSRGRLTVLFEADGGEEVVLARFPTPRPTLTLALPGAEAGFVRLSFRTSPAPQRSAGVTVVGPTIRGPGALGSNDPTQATKAPAPPPARPPNVIVYLVDALRADHLGCYGYPKPTSPNLDAFAEEAVLFENAMAETPWTRASVASLFTGLYPKTHGVNDRHDALASEASTVAEVLSAAGYRTVSFTTNGNIAEPFGFHQGFDQFFHLPEPLGDPGSQQSDQVNQHVLAWLDEYGSRNEPFLLYVHTTDPHSPYTPPPRFRRQFVPETLPPDVGTIAWMGGLRRQEVAATADLAHQLLALYDGEIAFNDHSFGVLMEELKRRGLYDDSLIIFLSDHGEEFLDHGQWEHGQSLFQPVLAIPLVVKPPSTPNRGTRIERPVQLIDVLPTILNAVGLDGAQSLPGVDLLADPEPRDQVSRKRAVYSHLDLDGLVGRSVVADSWRLIRQWRLGGPEGHESNLRLYDRSVDPGERLNLVEHRPVVRGYLLSLLRSYDQAGPAHKPGRANPDPELVRRLKALGYLQF